MREEILNLTHEDIVKSQSLRPLKEKRDYLEGIKQSLNSFVFGQDEAMEALARAIVRCEAGISNPNRPLGVYLCLGVTGCGKSESARAVSNHWFKDPDSKQLMRLDMAEFNQSHDVMRFTGAPPSYVGYGDPPIFTKEFLEKRNIILFDEIEKAHPAVHRMLLGILENGSLSVNQPTDKVNSFSSRQEAKREKLNFANSLILMTCNVGAERLQRVKEGKSEIGFQPNRNNYSDRKKIKDIGMEELKKSFRGMPEFLNRIDEIIVFNDLEPKHYVQIFYKLLGEINRNQLYGNNYIAATQEARDWVVKKARKHPEWGARELRRMIEKYLVTPIADYIMEGELKLDEPVVADFDKDKIVFFAAEKPPEEGKKKIKIEGEEKPAEEKEVKKRRGWQ